MSSFPLKIVTPEGLIFDGQAEKLIVRTTSGDTAILARHINYVTPLGMGQAVVVADGNRRQGACIGGILSMVNGECTLLPTTFEWAESIDVERAEASRLKAEKILADSNSTEADLQLAKARLCRALIRKNVASFK